MKNRQLQNEQYSVGKRWTEDLARRGHTPVVTVFLENYARLTPPLTTSEAMLVVHIMSHKWTEDDPFPSVARLARLMGVSDRYVRKMCETLESVGYLTRVGRIGTTNQFKLDGLFRKLEECIGIVRPLAVVTPIRDEASPTSDELDELLGQNQAAA